MQYFKIKINEKEGVLIQIKFFKTMFARYCFKNKITFLDKPIV